MTKTLLLAAAAGLFTAGAALAQLGPTPQMAPQAVPMAGDPSAMAPGAPPAAGFDKGGHGRGRFAQMDANGDGKVTQQEFVAFQDRMFDRVDVNHKGQIAKADVDAFMAQRQAEEAGRMTRGHGGRGGGAGEKISDRLADGGVLTRAQWEGMSARRFARMDAAHLGYLTPDTLHPVGGARTGGADE